MNEKTPLVVIALSLSFFISYQSIYAQSLNIDERKFEVGGHFSVFHNFDTFSVTTPIPVLCPSPPCSIVTEQTKAGGETDSGFGGRFGYRLTNNFTLEAEGNFFPKDNLFDGGRKIQGLFGIKVGKRFDKIGIFGKARPGFIRFGKGDFKPAAVVCIQIFPPPVGCFEPTSQTNFAFDVGGVVELYTSKHALIRFDAGDTIVHFSDRRVAVPNRTFPAGVVLGVPAETNHNFQGSVGVGFRF